MSIKITLFAAIAAIGIAIAPAAAKPGDHHNHNSSPHGKKSSHNSHSGNKWSHHKGGKHDKWNKHDKHDKWDKHAKHHGHDKWKHHAHHNWHHKPWHKKHYEAPTVYTYSRPVYTAPTTYTYTNSKPAYAYAPSSCTCLSKEYADDGSVVFKDNCTKEMAVYSKEDEN